MPSGGRRRGAGRPRGSKNGPGKNVERVAARLTRYLLAAYATAQTAGTEAIPTNGESALDCLLRMMRNPKLSWGLRAKAAAAAAPYIHPKQPKAIHVQSEVITAGVEVTIVGGSPEHDAAGADERNANCRRAIAGRIGGRSTKESAKSNRKSAKNSTKNQVFKEASRS